MSSPTWMSSPSSGRRHEATRDNDEGGVATLVEEEVEEPIVIDVSQTPDEEKAEPYIEIYARREGEDRLVTSIEILSITNKTLGTPGRLKYLEKQSEILEGQVHLVEIDLLRGGAHVSAVPLWLAREKAGLFDYHVSIRRFDRPSEFLLYPIRLERKLPTIKIPLLPGDARCAAQPPVRLPARLRRRPLPPRRGLRRRPHRPTFDPEPAGLGRQDPREVVGAEAQHIVADKPQVDTA